MQFLIYLVRHLKCLKSPLQVAVSQQLPSVVFQEFRLYKSNVLARLPFFKFLWCLADSTKQFRVGRGSLGHQQPNSKRWREVNSDNSSTPPCLLRAPQGHTLPAWPACLSVAADLSQSYMCLSLHPPHLLCWHCSLMPIYKDEVRSMRVYACRSRALLMFHNMFDVLGTSDKTFDNHQLNRQVSARCL